MGIPRSKWVNALDPEGVYKPAGDVSVAVAAGGASSAGVVDNADTVSAPGAARKAKKNKQKTRAGKRRRMLLAAEMRGLPMKRRNPQHMDPERGWRWRRDRVYPSRL
jgi:pyruvate/2-oxoglutarate dehydrogenase complex dihydrolipoamide acyltransferase (E2) component